MRVVRRLYFYLITLIGLEAVIWGAISLARTIVKQLPLFGTLDMLAGGLSAVLVGLPVFSIHWLTIQRDARQDEEEKQARLRAVFLYGVRLVTLIPVAHNLLALVNRTAFSLLNVLPSFAWLGGGQTVWDNLIAMVINLAVWFYFDHVLRAEWSDRSEENYLVGVRRLYRYIWVIYSLVLTIIGVRELIKLVLSLLESPPLIMVQWLGNGLAFSLVGMGLFGWSWTVVQRACAVTPAEASSTLRLGVLYVLSWAGAALALISSGEILNHLLRLALGGFASYSEFLTEIRDALALLMPIAVVWFYFNLQRLQQASIETDELRRATQEHLFFSFLSLGGLSALIIGLWQLLGVLNDLLFGRLISTLRLRDPLAGALSTLLIGLILWLLTWLRLQTESRRLDRVGDHLRRSIVRKGYLYLVIFVLVIALMSSAGAAIYRAVLHLLGQEEPDFWRFLSLDWEHIVLVVTWLFYHLSVLRQDAQCVRQTLRERYADFSVLILQSEENDFSEALARAIQQQVPGASIFLRRPGSEPLEDELLSVKAILMSSGLALQPPESLRLWLEAYRGKRLLLPVGFSGWNFVGMSERPLRERIREAAQTVRYLAEERTLPATVAPAFGWSTLLNIFGWLFILLLAFWFFVLVTSVIGLWD